MNEENPLVSIIVRTKDRPKLLKKALQSITDQTYRPIEVILVNDGGCDLDIEEMKNILNDVSLNYTRFEKNAGRAYAGNIGIQNAQGKYVGFLDDDDRLYKNHVSELVNFFEGKDCTVAYSDAEISYIEFDTVQQEFITKQKMLFASKDFSAEELITDNFIPIMTLLFTRSILNEIQGFDERFDLYEDWDLLIRLSEKYHFFHLNLVTAEYTQWSVTDQVAQTPAFSGKAALAHEHIIEKHKARVTPFVIRSLVQDKRMSNKKIRSLEKTAEKKDLYITELERKITEGVEELAQKDEALAQKDEALAQKDEALAQKDEALAVLEKTLNRIYESRGWKALAAYYRVRDRFIPFNSKRRLLYELLLLAVEHPNELFKNLTKQNFRKFIRQYKVLEPSALESKIKKKLPYHHSAMPCSIDSISSDEEIFGSVQNLNPPGEKNHILIIDRGIPTYDKDSGSLRMHTLLKLLNTLNYKISFLPDDFQRVEPYTREMEKMGIHVLTGRLNFEMFLQRMGGSFSYVLLSRPEQAFKYLPLIRAYAIHSTVVYDTVDLHWIRFERAAAVKGDKELLNRANHFKSVELFNASCSDIIFTVTGDERALLMKEIPNLRIEVISNIHDCIKEDEITPFDNRKDIMFIGGFLHEPNEDAVLFFVSEIFPLVKEKLPDARFFAVGSYPSDALLKLNSENIIVTGFVKEVRPYFDTCRVFVAPLRYGAGMKGKIGQSMAYGLPVVTTTIGAEGFGLIDYNNALIADRPEDFANATIQLYTNKNLWGEISMRSVEYIREKFSQEVISQKISDLFHSLAH
jgi:glycosyltransferase involved in cell wall biosynthesis